MPLRLRLAHAFALILFTASVSFAGARLIQGTYCNYALGFSVKIPLGLKAVAGDQSGPERGVRIFLPSKGDIAVFGEPNSLGWQSPAEGVRYDLARETCPSSSNHLFASTRVGDSDDGQGIIGAQGILVCGDRFVKVLLVFRPAGGPIYWLRLVTTVARKSEGSNYLDSVAHSFNLIPFPGANLPGAAEPLARQRIWREGVVDARLHPTSGTGFSSAGASLS